MTASGCSAAQKTLGIDLALCRHFKNKFNPFTLNHSGLVLAWNVLTTILYTSMRSLQPVLDYVHSSMGVSPFQNDARVFLYWGSGQILLPRTRSSEASAGQGWEYQPTSLLLLENGLSHVRKQNIWAGIYLRSGATDHIFIMFTHMILMQLCSLDAHWG